MRILILGGDAYLWWPTDAVLGSWPRRALVNNYLRRRAHEEVGTDSLVPVLGSLLGGRPRRKGHRQGHRDRLDKRQPGPRDGRANHTPLRPSRPDGR
jgi:hypothetical protein